MLRPDLHRHDWPMLIDYSASLEVALTDLFLQSSSHNEQRISQNSPERCMAGADLEHPVGKVY